MSVLYRVFLLAGLLFDAANLGALSADKPFSHLVHTVWRAADGWTQRNAEAIAQTPDGYLWVGTQEGLVRFDGSRFTVFDRGNTVQMAQSFVSALLAARDGNLWIGTYGGGLLHLEVKTGRFTAIPIESAGVAMVRKLAEGRDGSIWMATDGGVARWKDGRLAIYTVDQGLDSNQVRSVLEDRAGNLWAGTTEGLNVLRGERFSPAKAIAANGVEIRKPVYAIYEDREGAVWFGMHPGGLNRLHHGQLTAVTTLQGLSSNSVTAIEGDREGSLWVGTRGGGLNRLWNGRFTRYTSAEGLSNDTIASILEDRSGDLWVGTAGTAPLNRLKDTNVRRFAKAKGFQGEQAWSISAARGGGFWVAASGALNRFRFNASHGGLFETYAPRGWPANPVVRTAIEARDGSLWVGFEGAGLSVTRNGATTLYTTRNGLSNDLVYALAEDARGAIWIGADDGLSCFENGRFTAIGRAQGLPNTTIRAIHAARDGSIWLGTNAGAVRYRAGVVSVFDVRSGMASNLPRAFHEDADGTMWIGTLGGGLSRIRDGRVATFSRREGLADDSIRAILEDDRGNLWLQGNSQLMRVAKRELENYANTKGAARDPIEFLVVGPADGWPLSGGGGSSPNAVKSEDGRLWFQSETGIASISPDDWGKSQVIPQVALDSVRVGGHRLMPGEDPSQFHSRDLEFDYTAIDLSGVGGIRFRYRLEGYDAKWIEAGERRTAFYTKVPPGNYTFRVSAYGTRGRFGAADTRYALYLAPRLTERPGFYGACLLAAAALAWQLHVFNKRRLAARARQLAQLVERQTRTLRTEVAERRQAEQDAAKARAIAEAASRAKSDFLAVVSHEIRTPMNAILGIAELLSETELNCDQRRYVDAFRRNGSGLLGLIDDILDLSKIEAGEMELHRARFALRDVVRQVEYLFEVEARAKGLALASRVPDDAPAEVIGDASRLRQVLVNLLGNAVKFTERGGVVFELKCPEPLSIGGGAPGKIEFVVSDTGVGIPREMQERIFDAFTQADSSAARKYGGVGLGLCISQRIVRAMGGSITVASEEGQGSSFSFTVEFELSAAPAPGASRAPDRSERAPVPMRILIADDSSDNRMLLQAYLKRTGHTLTFAFDGEQAVKAFRAGDFDLALMDIQMPVMDGLTATRMIRAIEKESGREPIPVLALTANARGSDIELSRNAGCNLHLSKPISKASLLAALDAHAPVLRNG
jgi:signal transduction histidine kinase/ligand-binding sensor domain-containing protein/ActR/RegA family two-component response regulator